ncbi:hypothetical protein [Gulosibacter chungangensis]|uniref:Uncharacterized protein n=1 Tax=Gulosibacter chungangensis TaxID=979746 RepID=A0A7J5B7D2_9MICO|nr:hypothetical protein [Gulosibacter chungangensis]KAB1640575.1 hypothetical protein F8O05_14515 [Gulosibacter chungangensis]
MSTSIYSRSNDPQWWQKLGLSPDGIGIVPGRFIDHRALVDLLRSYEPTAFKRKVGGAEQITIDELRERILEEDDRQKREIEAAKAVQAREHRQLGWDRIEAAYAAPDAEEIITVGRWEGFTRAAATAWCWNLYQYEPRGFAHPASEVRARAITQFKNGGLPEVLGYPKRARELEALGLTPRTYREHKEALGSKPSPDLRF